MMSKFNSQALSQLGFTFIEAILYVSIITIMLSALVPFVWNILFVKAKSSIQHEVSSNARFISERVKSEIRNSTGINSVTSTSISLVKATSSLNPTVITWSVPNITIKQGSGPTTNLNSASVHVTNFLFTNNSSVDLLTQNIGFTFSIEQSGSGPRAEYKASETYQSAVELRGF